jgi:hypothetical protein
MSMSKISLLSNTSQSCILEPAWQLTALLLIGICR